MILPRFERVLQKRKGITMAKVQKVYPREFKEEAVRLAQTSGKPIAQIARELGHSDANSSEWGLLIQSSRYLFLDAP
jgi:transposase-like protein